MQRNITIGIIWVVIVALIIFGATLLFRSAKDSQPVEFVEDEVEKVVTKKTQSVIGTSVEGRIIEVFRYGNGEKHLLFVGGIHGGYEWNSTLLAYQIIDYLDVNPDFVPENITISIIPSANPDGLYSVVKKEGRFVTEDVPLGFDTTIGRFNSNDVDLNRNFDCKWKEESTWRGNIVSAGASPFSEAEAVAIRDYVLQTSPEAVVFWHSKASAVYASECENGVLPETLDVMNTYATASGYRPVPAFDAYEITGDAEGWLASIGIPAITVELTTHETIEFEKNLAGITALVESYSK